MGWTQYRGSDGLLWWANVPTEGYGVRVVADVMDGQAVAVGLHVEPMPGATPRPLTQTALKRIPLAQLAAITSAEDVGAFVRSLSAPLDTADARRLGASLSRAVAHVRTSSPVEVPPEVERAADVWNTAYARGEAPRDAVMASEHVSARTADRRIDRARELGLIVVAKRNGGRRAPKSTGREGERA